MNMRKIIGVILLALVGACSEPYFVDIIGGQTKLDYYQDREICGAYYWKSDVRCMAARGWELRWK